VRGGAGMGALIAGLQRGPLSEVAASQRRCIRW